MTARAAKLLGLDTTADDAEELLLLFADGDSVSSWAKAAVAYCFENSILPDTGTVEPTRAILRSEVAQMIYNLLDTAGKI